MKRTLLAALSASLFLFGVPSVAAAHHSKRHAACRASTHKHHAKCAHARARVLSFGPNFRAPAGSMGSAPSTPTPGSPETAGMVTSYVAPTLTITLNDKTEVSGKVTAETRIECESATPTPGGGEEGDDDGGTEGSVDGSEGPGGHGDAAVASSASTEQDDEGEGDDDGNVQPCTTSALVHGTVVRAAELILGGEGAVWEKVILVS
jgi:hypothetical protein